MNTSLRKSRHSCCGTRQMCFQASWIMCYFGTYFLLIDRVVLIGMKGSIYPAPWYVSHLCITSESERVPPLQKIERFAKHGPEFFEEGWYRGGRAKISLDISLSRLTHVCSIMQRDMAMLCDKIKAQCLWDRLVIIVSRSLRGSYA